MNKRQSKKMKKLVNSYLLMAENSEPFLNLVYDDALKKGHVLSTWIYWSQSMNRYLLNVEKSKGPYAHPSNYRHWKKGKRYNLKQHGM